MLISLRGRLSSSSLIYDTLRLITRIEFYTLGFIPKDKRNFKGDSTMTSMTALLRHFHEYYGLSAVSFDCKSQVTHSQNRENQSHACCPVTGWCVHLSDSGHTSSQKPNKNTSILRYSSLRGEKKSTWQFMHRLVE